MKNKHKTVHVIFRYDDFSSSSPTEMEEKIIAVFKKHDAPLIISVIPFIASQNVLNPSPQALLPLQEEKAAILRQGHKDGIIDIALHGHTHQSMHPDRRSEFVGLGRAVQLEKLTTARSYIERVVGVRPQVFVPPWNAYDHETLTALEELDFTTLSADCRGVAPKDSALSFVPFTCSLDQLQDAIIIARKSLDPQPVIVVLFHIYDFLEHDALQGKLSFGELDALLAWLTAQDDVRVVSITQAVAGGVDLGSRRLRRARMNRKLAKFFPFFFRKDCLYLHSSVIYGTISKVMAFSLVVIASAASIVYVAWKILAAPSANIVL
ncbi:DUF2334 domain-containing protein [Desulfonatronum thiodismutans]|uniref:DUF2334 domain-containing protein n=1 Tax=Desulfonatronum thiodismutans TaxID=159290 RepID=UPI000A05E04B|nr:DUF2334 domain-containing protein [Desulfonatronum thiodismutans]